MGGGSTELQEVKAEVKRLKTGLLTLRKRIEDLEKAWEPARKAASVSSRPRKSA